MDDNGVATIVNIHVIFYTTSDIEMEKTFCEGSSITFGGQQISEGGDYVFDAQDLHGCPIHINLHVTESPNYSLEKDTTICDGEYIYFYNMVYYNGDHTATFHTVDGCDSIVTLHIHTLHRSYTEIYDTLTESTYQFGDRTLYSAGEYEERLTNQWGCDSIVTLHLWAEPCRLWVPNIFTPDEETNNKFAIFGCGLLQADVWIFDRGGDFVAHFDGLTETWDGTHRGVPCRVGTYVYRIAYRCTDDTHLEHVKVGAITLVR